MLKRSLAAGALAAALAAPAAHAQSASTPRTPVPATAGAPLYRLMVTADLTKQGDSSGPVYAFGSSPGYGETPTPSLLRFNIGRRFGRSFAIEGRESVEEPMANGTWVTSGPVKLEFDLCARGGRTASDC